MSITELAEVRSSSARVRVERLVEELAAEVAWLDGAVGGLSGREAAALVGPLSRLSRLADAGVTLAAGRVAATGSYREAGSTTARQWLSSATGASAGEAGRAISTAEAVNDEALAPTRAALVDGSLTGAQAAEVASAAVKAPDEQGRLLGVAASGTAKRLRDECRKVRLAGEPAEDPRTRRERLVRELRFSTRDLGDGLSELAATMPTSWMVLVLTAVHQQCDAVFARARAEGRDDPHQAYLVEALVTLLLVGDLTGAGYGDGTGAARDGEPPNGGSDDLVADVDDHAGANAGGAAGRDETSDDRPSDPQAPGTGEHDFGGAAGFDPFDDPLYAELRAAIGGEGPAPPRQARRLRRGRCRCGGRVAPRAKILVRVDQAALLRGWTEGAETCDIAGVGPVPVATVRELWPDAAVKLVLTNGDDVRNVTHLGRRATDAIEAAMQWMSGGACTNEACDNDRFVEVDHRVGWANTHRTRLDELDPLCSTCHASKTRDNWQLVRGVGRRRLVPPDHPEHPGDPPTPVRRE